MIVPLTVSGQDRAVAFVVWLLAMGTLSLVVALLRERARARTSEERRRLCPESLVYDVPPGQRSADVIRALDWAGYRAQAGGAEGSRRVLVACSADDPAARRVVRAVIEAVPSAAPSTIRFTDEA